MTAERDPPKTVEEKVGPDDEAQNPQTADRPFGQNDKSGDDPYDTGNEQQPPKPLAKYAVEWAGCTSNTTRASGSNTNALDTACPQTCIMLTSNGTAPSSTIMQPWGSAGRGGVSASACFG